MSFLIVACSRSRLACVPEKKIKHTKKKHSKDVILNKLWKYIKKNLTDLVQFIHETFPLDIKNSL